MGLAQSLARLLAVSLLALGLGQTAQAKDLVTDIAVLQALDKTTARITTLQALVGQPVHFGSLEVVVRTCRKHPPEEEPESAAFLDIWDTKPNQPAQEVFRGWMFASSPAVSAMEHPVYDIWVLDCLSSSEGETGKSSGN